MAQRLDESNKGHQLLKAMGWGGAGLGSKEQGIAEPISGGEVRRAGPGLGDAGWREGGGNLMDGTTAYFSIYLNAGFLCFMPFQLRYASLRTVLYYYSRVVFSSS